MLGPLLGAGDTGVRARQIVPAAQSVLAGGGNKEANE